MRQLRPKGYIGNKVLTYVLLAIVRRVKTANLDKHDGKGGSVEMEV